MYALASRRALLAIVVPILLGACSAESTCEHYRGKSFDPMPEKAIAACTKVCESGDEEACAAVERWAHARLSAAATDAVIAYRDGADCAGPAQVGCEASCSEAGNVRACVTLGVASQYGDSSGTTIDLGAAARFYASGCRSYDPSKRCSIDLQLPGDQLASDEELPSVRDGSCPGTLDASTDIERYAQDCADACFARLACDHWLELGCETDLADCETRCEGGDAAVCRQLFLMQREGRGMAKNGALAEARRAKACELGDTFSCDAASGRLRASAKAKPTSLP